MSEDSEDSADSDSKPSMVLMYRMEKERACFKEQLIEAQRERDEAVTKAKDEVTSLQDEKNQMESEVKAPYIVFLTTNSKGEIKTSKTGEELFKTTSI
jgi:hypothetical protein